VISVAAYKLHINSTGPYKPSAAIPGSFRQVPQQSRWDYRSGSAWAVRDKPSGARYANPARQSRARPRPARSADAAVPPESRQEAAPTGRWPSACYGTVTGFGHGGWRVADIRLLYVFTVGPRVLILVRTRANVAEVVV
jgi:hypothetical protein